ncbi:MAG: hypothetical protein IJ427_11175, partial [Lachnospiraceae bacterium]|nr:hypothetical protein [Lachnospiraceae bacterium]
MKRNYVLGMLAVALCLAGCSTGQATDVTPTASLQEEVTQAPAEETPTPVPTNKTEQEEMTAKPTKRPAGAGSPQLLLGQMKLMKEQYQNLSQYRNGDTLQAAFDKADALVERGETEIVSQQEYNDMLKELRETISNLVN